VKLYVSRVATAQSTVIPAPVTAMTRRSCRRLLLTEELLEHGVREGSRPGDESGKSDPETVGERIGVMSSCRQGGENLAQAARRGSVPQEEEQIHGRMNAGNVGKIRSWVGRRPKDVEPLCSPLLDDVGHNVPRFENGDRPARADGRYLRNAKSDARPRRAGG
jgi:hypothetical protein